MSADPRGPLHTLRADLVGSFLRPDWLKEVYARHGQGQASDEELRQAQDVAVRQVIAKQEELSYPVVTDGEFRRLQFQESFIASVSGWQGEYRTIHEYDQRAAGARPLQRWDLDVPNEGGKPRSLRIRAVDRLRLARNQPLEEYRFSSGVARTPVKVTLINVDRLVERFDDEGSRPVYPDVESYIADVVSIERQIVSELVDVGCQYVQIDAPSYTRYVDPPSLERMRAKGIDPVASLRRSIDADNAVISGLGGVTIGLHMCRGNQQSMWHREGSYDAIAEQLFNGLQHHRFLLEYDTERAGGFEPLRFVPKGKTVVLGLVSTKVPQLESTDELKRRVDEASRFLPLEQLAISPQCGFASSIPGNLIGEDDQWRKLEIVRKVADEVWG